MDNVTTQACTCLKSLILQSIHAKGKNTDLIEQLVNSSQNSRLHLVC